MGPMPHLDFVLASILIAPPAGAPAPAAAGVEPAPAGEAAPEPAPAAVDVAAMIGQYRTTGSASPAETRRVASELLTELSAG